MEHITHQSWLFYMVIGAGGALGGYTAGLFGIGGGVVLVPTLFTLLPHLGSGPGNVMHQSVATCLALIVPGAIMAGWKQYRLGNLILAHLKSWVPAVVLGSILGAVLLNYIPSEGLKIFFTVYLFSVTVYAVVEKERPVGSEGMPHGWLKGVLGFLIGGLSVLLGIGGGTFTVPYYKFSGYPLKKAIALSTATSLFIGAVGAAGSIIDGWGRADLAPYSLGFVHVPSFLILTPFMIFLAPLGSRTASHLPDKVLKWVYAAFLATVTGYMIFKIT